MQKYILRKRMKSLMQKICLISILILALMPALVLGQQYKWLSAGSLHNWISEQGCEIEVGRTPGSPQQDGLQWPAMLPYQDIQAAKGFWIGCQDFTDERGDTYDTRVVTVGPRSKGFSEFFPLQFDMVSRFEVPQVYVDGLPSSSKVVNNDYVDPNMDADRMVINVTNTLLGITMTRKVMQFSVPGHDNYHIYDFTFVNTGNIDDDAEIELPDNTLNDVIFFWQYRWAPCYQTRYIIGNGSGWGMNTMLDARGDGSENPGLYGDPQDEREYNGKQIRCQFAWHGYFKEKVVDYDNIGGPIMRPYNPYVATYDTVGRLGAPQFVGVLTLHADKSADEHVDDPGQPFTTGWYGSDLPETGPNSDPYNLKEMQERYRWMQLGNFSPRHAYAAVEDGNFASQTDPGNEIDQGNPKSGKPGGFSAGNGYGPYQMAPGDTIRIVMVEAVNGLGTERCIEVGNDFKNGVITNVEKNEIFLTGKDSLFKTFRNAIDNYMSGYQIQRPPKPPKIFQVQGGGDRISLNWDVYDTENLAGFKIYRSRGEYNNPLETAELVYEADADERSYDDLTPVRGVAYYYYIQSVGLNGMESNRHYSQAYDPSFLQRPMGTAMDQIRVVPNPFIVSSDETRLRFPGLRETDKLAFFNVPGQCKIQIYTETGQLIKTLINDQGKGDLYWYNITESNQFVVSGVYIAYIEVTEDIPDPDNPDRLIYKKGDNKTIKFVVIR